ncbi:unnamed protein product, partial [Meganyctiphanes norvegica]
MATSLMDIVIDLIANKIFNLMQKPSQGMIELSAKGPALANAALILSEGCPKKYEIELRRLYTFNNLPCPDFDSVFDNKLYTLKDQSTQTEPVMKYTIASQTDIGNKILSKEPVFLCPEICREEYSETKQFGDVLRAIDNVATSYDEMEDILNDVEEIPTTPNEVEEILSAFETINSFHNPFGKQNDHSISSTDMTFDSIDINRTAFNSHFYALTPCGSRNFEKSFPEFGGLPPCDWADDWFDENPSASRMFKSGLLTGNFASTAKIPEFSRTTSLASRMKSSQLYKRPLTASVNLLDVFENCESPEASSLYKSLSSSRPLNKPETFRRST